MSVGKKRVFISSVQKELEIERVAIAGAVSGDEGLSQLCNVVLYDKEPLSGRRIVKPYLKCLDSCDIYILVIDREYGRIVERISATHEEYQEHFDISKVTATKELRALVEAGFAEQIGKGRSVRYVYRGSAIGK